MLLCVGESRAGFFCVYVTLYINQGRIFYILKWDIHRRPVQYDSYIFFKNLHVAKSASCKVLIGSSLGNFSCSDFSPSYFFENQHKILFLIHIYFKKMQLYILYYHLLVSKFESQTPLTKWKRRKTVSLKSALELVLHWIDKYTGIKSLYPRFQRTSAVVLFSLILLEADPAPKFNVPLICTLGLKKSPGETSLTGMFPVSKKQMHIEKYENTSFCKPVYCITTSHKANLKVSNENLFDGRIYNLFQ